MTANRESEELMNRRQKRSEKAGGVAPAGGAGQDCWKTALGDRRKGEQVCRPAWD